MVTGFKLSKFINLFGGIEKIDSIREFTLDELDQLQDMDDGDAVRFMHSKNNLLQDDAYLVLLNGEYTLNKEKIFDDYADREVYMYTPVIQAEDLEKIDKTKIPVSSDDYVIELGKYANGCEVLISKTNILDYEIEDINERFVPDTDSKINCFVLVDYIYDPDNCENNMATCVVNAVENKEQLYDALSKRKDLYTAVYTIVNGKANYEDDFIFYTTPEGRCHQLSRLNICTDDLFEEE